MMKSESAFCFYRDELGGSSDDSCVGVDTDIDSDGDRLSEFGSRPFVPSKCVAQQQLCLADLISRGRQKKNDFTQPNEWNLPALPPLELPPQSKSNHGGDSSCGSSSSDAHEIGDPDDIYVTGGKWGSMTAPCTGIATDEEEEILMLDGAIRLGNDTKANQIIVEFDKRESASHEWQSFIGLPSRSRRAPSRDFLLNLPIIFFGKEQPNNCMICVNEFNPEDRCIRLPCRHLFHMVCILPWLLEQNKCPGCRTDVEEESCSMRRATGNVVENTQALGLAAVHSHITHHIHQGDQGQEENQEGSAIASSEANQWDDQLLTGS